MFEDDIYYFNKGLIYDSSFIEAPKELSFAVLNDYYQKKDFSGYNKLQLIEHIKLLKKSEFYEECLRVINYGALKFSDEEYYKTVFPIATSCYRSMGQSQKAIDFWMKNKDIYKSCLSVPLLTSLAAAYCDVKNYDMAKYCADKAYYLQGGGINFKTELSLVYMRIKKETNDAYPIDN